MKRNKLTEKEVEDFFIKNGLSDVLENKRDNDANYYLRPYRCLPRLEGYTLMTADKSVLVPNKTFIKYIKIDSAFSSTNLNSHIKTGGFLLSCGKFIGDKYVKNDNPVNWIYAQLKYNPCPFIDEQDNIIVNSSDIKIFYINLRKCYVFYKSLRKGWRDILENIEIELA